MTKSLNICNDISINQAKYKTLADDLYYKQFGQRINWLNPKDLNEKINWLAFNTDTSLWSKLTDKYLMRQHIISKGYSNILPKLYGVWENVSEIDFETLPNKFVLKCNHDSGSVVIVNNKEKCNIDKIKKHLASFISAPFGIKTAEPHYIGIKRIIIAEELLENDSKLSDSMIEYKFWSFYGKSEYCLVCYDTTNWLNKKTGIYRINTWKLCEEKMNNHDKQVAKYIHKPKFLNEMLEIILYFTKDFPQCRVDFYETNKKVYFSEFTFTSNCGRIKNFTPDFLVELGNKIILK